MTPTIVDTTILIDASRDRAPAVRFLAEALTVAPLWSSVLVRSELWAGARIGDDAILEGLLDRFKWQDVTVSIADLAGRLANRYRRSHHIGFVDLVVAATAIELGGSVATLNVRDFPMFPDLKPPY